jgi:hypothetical protein
MIRFVVAPVANGKRGTYGHHGPQPTPRHARGKFDTTQSFQSLNITTIRSDQSEERLETLITAHVVGPARLIRSRLRFGHPTTGTQRNVGSLDADVRSTTGSTASPVRKDEACQTFPREKSFTPTAVYNK